MSRTTMEVDTNLQHSTGAVLFTRRFLRASNLDGVRFPFNRQGKTWRIDDTLSVLPSSRNTNGSRESRSIYTSVWFAADDQTRA